MHLWRVPLDDAAQDHEALSPAERRRGEKFLRPSDRHRFLNARARLRAVLSRYAEVPPADLAFEIGTHGKPALSGGQAWLRFNLSHADGWMLLAVSRSREVGVDLEAVREKIEFEAVAAQCFRPEEVRTLKSLPSGEKSNRFYALWTATEARLKARGIGFLEAEPADGAPWQSYPVSVQDGFAAAIAVSGGQPQLQCWSWPN